MTVDIGGASSFLHWREITLIMAVMVTRGSELIMMMTFETRDERVLMLSEIDAAWSMTTENLHLYLPDAFPFAVWGQRLIAGAGFTEVWEAAA